MPNTSRAPFLETIPAHQPKDHFLRFFGQKYAARYRFGHLPIQERLVLAHTIASTDGRLAFIKNSKAGCTTVAHLIYRYDHGQRYDGDIHHAPMGLRVGIEQWSVLKNQLETAVSFSTVRQPASRTVSAFYDFFVIRQNPEAQIHLDRIEAFGFSRKDDLNYRFDAYLDYVEASLEISELRTDRHFRPQHINLGHGTFELSFTGKVETLKVDLQHVAEMADMQFPVTESPAEKRRNTSGSEKFAPGAKQLRRIESLYAKDYEIYGY